MQENYQENKKFVLFDYDDFYFHMSLGSNFFVIDQILDIDLEDSIFVMKKHAEAILAQKVTLEREKNIVIETKFPPVELVSSMICSHVDSNHKPTP